MKLHWSDLTPEEQAAFGNGCTFVPDFIFEKLCCKHDWFYSIGCGANKWYENLWKGPYYKISEDLRMGYWGVKNAFDTQTKPLAVLYSIIAVIYSIGLIFLPFSWFYFTYGPWKTVDEVVQNDQEKKCR